MAQDKVERMPIVGWLAPALALALLGALFGRLIGSGPWVLAASSLLLGASVFAAVHHAEIVALKVGEPYGSILLALSVTVIEVALIVSIMISGGPGSESVARDTVFSALMIVMNGIIGLCLLLGGRRHHVQDFRADGSVVSLGVLGTLVTLALVLPNYTTGTIGPTFSTGQLIFVGIVSLALYAVFIFVQTVRHRQYFLGAGDDGDEGHGPPSSRITALSAALLLISLACVVLLAKLLSYPLGSAVAQLGLPQAFVGVVIAAIVLLPEGMASIRAAIANRFQTSLNLALGSALATIGLTIPAVAVVSVLLGQRLVLGLAPDATVLLLLTLFVSTLTLGTGRTNVLQGAVHLVIFGVFMLLSVAP